MNFSRHAQLTRWSQRMCGRSFSQRAVKAHEERAKRGGGDDRGPRNILRGPQLAQRSNTAHNNN